MPERPTLDRIRGCLLGGALGDVLGYPIEFATRTSIERIVGAAPPRRLAATPGAALVSDDTQLTLFVAEGLVRAARDGGDPRAHGLRALRRWYSTQLGDPPPMTGSGLLAEPRLHARRAPGRTCMTALAAVTDATACSAIVRNDSKGCGGVMRAAPFGVLATPELAFERATRDAGFTHGHPTGYLAAGYLAAAIWHLVRAVPLHDALAAADRLLADRADNRELVAALDRARLLACEAPLAPGIVEHLGGGWIAEEALAIAVACALFHDRLSLSIEDTLWLAACHGGDSDSTASLTGNLLGASRGAVALPATWLADLELRALITRVADELHGLG